MAVGLWDSSFKNAFHTLSYRFAAVILVILYSRGKGKELKDAEQGCIADTLTNFVGAFDCIDKLKYALRRSFEPQKQRFTLVFSVPGANILNKVKNKQNEA